MTARICWRLLDRHGAAHPAPDATHFSTDMGRYHMKWESHTEFVTYTTFEQGLTDRPFDPASFDVYPSEWLAEAPGNRLTSIIMRIEVMPETHEDMIARCRTGSCPKALPPRRCWTGSRSLPAISA